MFKRRNKRSVIESVREWLWPRSGWIRSLTYYRHRLARIQDSSYRVAAGVACGVAVSFTPFIGLHVALALLMAYVMRANLVAAAIGTLIGNPWTFPFIWVLIYGVGASLLGMESGIPASETINTDLLLDDPLTALRPVFLPMIVGGLPLAFLSWWVTYWPLRRLVRRYRQRRLMQVENAILARRQLQETKGVKG